MPAVRQAAGQVRGLLHTTRACGRKGGQQGGAGEPVLLVGEVAVVVVGWIAWQKGG